MKRFYNTSRAFLSLLIVITACGLSFANETNNSYMFNGSSGSLKILDGQPVNGDASQDGFAYFNSNYSSSNKKITVDTWVYLLGDNPGKRMPVITRAVQDGSSFAMYIQDGTAYFSVGNSMPVSTANTFPSLPAFTWMRLTGTYDGSHLKLYYNGNLAASSSISLNQCSTNGIGLFIGSYQDDTFHGLIDEVRVFKKALSSNELNSCNGNGNPSSSIPSSLVPYLFGRWSFTEITTYYGTPVLKDYSVKKNYLRINGITDVVDTDHLPFFVVNSTQDLPDLSPGDGLADAGNGKVTLRSAIQEANVLPGIQTVYFYILTNGLLNLQPTSVLPEISEGIILDGTVQRGYSATPLIQTQGIYGGLKISAGVSTVQGLFLSSTSGPGLTLMGNGGNNINSNIISGITVGSASNNINGNTITNPAGDGISFITGGNNNQVGVLSTNNIQSNAGFGISLDGENNNQIVNNDISFNASGGISSINSSNNILKGNTLNGNLASGIALSASDGWVFFQNTISGNSGTGIIINGSENKLDSNIVVTNNGDGIRVESGNNNSLLYNSIYDNVGPGIRLNTLANDSQTYPTLNTFYTWQDETALPDIRGGTAIQGTLSSTPALNYRVQFYSNSGSTNKEGRNYLGEIEVTTDISGEADFLANLKDIVLQEGEVVSATATRLNNLSEPMSTSEFSESLVRSLDEGDHYKVNTTLAGIPLHWKEGKSDYQVAPSVVARGFDDEVQNGFDTWSNLDQLSYTRKTLPGSEKWGGSADGVNNIVWFPTSAAWEDSTGARQTFWLLRELDIMH